MVIFLNAEGGSLESESARATRVPPLDSNRPIAKRRVGNKITLSHASIFTNDFEEAHVAGKQEVNKEVKDDRGGKEEKSIRNNFGVDGGVDGALITLPDTAWSMDCLAAQESSRGTSWKGTIGGDCANSSLVHCSI